MIVYILMGVAGCGKSTVGRLAADLMDIPFLEGDDFHTDHNIAKMRNGTPLSDEDRMPWVDAMVEGCLGAPERQMILACSALSAVVRKRLKDRLNNKCLFIHLHGDQITLQKRLSDRSGHFFKADLLTSQFEALDMPKHAVQIDIEQPVETLVEAVCDIIRSEDKT